MTFFLFCSSSVHLPYIYTITQFFCSLHSVTFLVNGEARRWHGRENKVEEKIDTKKNKQKSVCKKKTIVTEHRYWKCEQKQHIFFSFHFVFSRSLLERAKLSLFAPFHFTRARTVCKTSSGKFLRLVFFSLVTLHSPNAILFFMNDNYLYQLLAAAWKISILHTQKHKYNSKPFLVNKCTQEMPFIRMT